MHCSLDQRPTIEFKLDGVRDDLTRNLTSICGEDQSAIIIYSATANDAKLQHCHYFGGVKKLEMFMSTFEPIN